MDFDEMKDRYMKKSFNLIPFCLNMTFIEEIICQYEIIKTKFVGIDDEAFIDIYLYAVCSFVLMRQNGVDNGNIEDRTAIYEKIISELEASDFSMTLDVMYKLLKNKDLPLESDSLAQR